MHAFVSTISMKTDAKGRISVPKPFRAVLQADGFEGLYCIPSPDGQSLDAGGSKLFSMFEEKLAALDPTSFEYDLLATAFFGESEILSIDKEGRIALPARLTAIAGIEGEAVFVGKGHKFQIWSPERYQTYRERAVSEARRVLWGAQGSTHSETSSEGRA
ncbi:MAG: division/cell wall cluster transcriptional repressor MraZ [Pseudomonadota bacterium]